MSEHFIKNIEIKNFKCFKDFKAEGFGRVNLIGGKNNVGKTAFMEACLLGLSWKNSKELFENFIILELHRNSLNFLLEWFKDYTAFKFKYIDSYILINDNFIPVSIVKENGYGNYNKYTKILIPSKEASGLIAGGYIEKCNSTSNIKVDRTLYKSEFDNKILDAIYEKNSPPLINNLKFISVGNNFNSYLVNFIDEIKLADKEEDLNQALKSFFDIKKIDIIKNKVMLKKESKYLLLSEFGDGVKHFLNIILALYLNKDSILYLDEIENGIHYTNLDKLWEIILTISKQQNVQVFATTHSKECIESYARVSKKLEDKEITFIELCKREEEIKAFVYPYDWFIDEIEQEHEVRGCL